MTAPITPDERAAMREYAERLYTYGGEEQVLADAALSLLDALDTAEAEVARLRTAHTHCDQEVYAETWNAGYENAMAQGLADDPALADDWLVEHDERVRRAAEAERDEARAELAVARQHQREASLTIRSVEGLRKERDDALAEVARLRAATSPAWDEDTVQAEVLGIDARHHFHGTACLCGFDSHGRARSATEHITSAVLAVVRRHLPVSGESRAQVQAEALREFARSLDVDEHALDRSDPGETAEVRAWMRSAAGSTAGAIKYDAENLADRLAAEGGDGR